MKQEISADSDGLGKLFGLFAAAADPERMLAFIKNGWDRLRWQSPEKDEAQRDAVAEQMRRIGMSEIWRSEVPSDGSTAFGGWVMPCRYRVTRGRIEVTEGACQGLVLFDYELNPAALMPGSGGTNGAVTAELILVEGDASARVKDKIVLLTNPDLQSVRKCFREGALGVMSDYKPHRPGVQEGSELDQATAWLNYAMPRWQEERGFGVSVTPADGRRIREALSRGTVKVRADIQAELSDARVPVVSAVWPERCKEEIVITGHLDEIGADDNLSGVAVSLEFVRVYRRLVDNGELEKPGRGIRLLFAPEAFGLQSYLADDSLPWSRFCLGLNVDTVGSAQDKVNTWLVHGETFPTAPHCADTLLEEILTQVRRLYPRFRHSTAQVDYIDNGIADPEVGAPTPQLYHFTCHHHTSLDRPESLDPAMLQRAVGIVGTYAAVFANRNADWAGWLARRAFAQGLNEITSAAADGGKQKVSLIHRLLKKHRSRMTTTGMLVPRTGLSYFVRDYASVEEAERKKAADEARNHARLVRELDQELERGAKWWLARPGGQERSSEPAEKKTMGILEELAYRKLFRGLVATESLHNGWHEKLRAIGFRPNWGAPLWLIMACFLCDGKHSVADVFRELGQLGCDVEPERLAAVLDILREAQLLATWPVLRKQDFLRALREVGIEQGDLVIAHTSLSRFGYVRGGADTVIEALREAVGEAGTLLLPAFTFSLIGRGCFDPESSPVVTGAVAERFRKIPGVLRSPHPIHSFCAMGPRARSLLKGHDKNMPPLAREGPAGKLVEWGGKIVMMARLQSNTTLHAGEYWGGYPFQDIYCCLRRADGAEEIVAVPQAPQHSNFEAAYDILRQEDKMRSVPLGRDRIYAMLAPDAVAAMARAFQQNPLLPTAAGCECRHCRAGREKYGHTGTCRQRRSCQDGVETQR